MDADDDDADGAPDFDASELSRAAHADLVPLPTSLAGAVVRPLSGGERVRLVDARGRPLPWERAIPAGASLQGKQAGALRAIAVFPGARGDEPGPGRVPFEVSVRGVRFVDGAGKPIDPARSHVSLARTPPARTRYPTDGTFDDPDGLRVVLELPEDEEAPPLVLESVSASGARIDALALPPLARAACPDDAGRAPPGVRCAASPPVRLVADETDRTHPLLEGRALRAEVGGALVVREAGKKLQMVRVLGPRSSPVGAIRRLRARVRPIVLRVAPGSAPAVGGNDAGAVAAMRAELAAAAAVWGQCGITFGDARALDVQIVDPPPPFLVAIGDDLGLPASGGEIRLKVDGRPVTLPVAAGRTPSAVASDLARAIERVGLVAVVSPNARIAPGAGGSVDVLVRRRSGQLVAVEPQQRDAPLTTDASLSVRVGAVDLRAGLHHFRDLDAVAGTLEERTLLKAIDDGDPRTVELVVVPSFAGGIRIGESFIGSDGSSVRNVVLVDRAGVRARRSSFTLAHELGHVLLDVPDHPDDYGLDTPTLLMDSDASDASAYGPRRLTVEECARAVRESGPSARVPILSEWPVGPLNVR